MLDVGIELCVDNCSIGLYEDGVVCLCDVVMWFECVDVD